MVLKLKVTHVIVYLSSLFNPEDPLPTNFEGPVTIDMPAGLDVAAAVGSGASVSPSGSGHPKLRLEMVSESFAALSAFLYYAFCEYCICQREGVSCKFWRGFPVNFDL